MLLITCNIFPSQTYIEKYNQSVHYEGLKQVLKSCFIPLASDVVLSSLVRSTNPETLICINDTIVVGYCDYNIISTEKACIDFLGVHKDYQNKGYGNILLIAAFDDMRSKDLSQVRLDVSPSAISAIYLYKKHGFKVVETYCNDLVQMSKTL